jgi:hypothetical protein
MPRLVLRKKSMSLTSKAELFAHPHAYVEVGVGNQLITMCCHFIFIHLTLKLARNDLLKSVGMSRVASPTFLAETWERYPVRTNSVVHSLLLRAQITP